MQRESSSVSSRSRGTFGVRTACPPVCGRSRVAFRALSLYCANVISFWIWSECFQVFNDRVFLLGREQRPVCRTFVADIRIPFIPVARCRAIRFYLCVEPEVLPWICRLVFAAPLVIEPTDVRNKSDPKKLPGVRRWALADRAVWAPSRYANTGRAARRHRAASLRSQRFFGNG